MKIVKLKEGYRIRASNSEYDALKYLVHSGFITEYARPKKDQGEGLGGGSSKAAFNRLMESGAKMEVTEDRSALND